MPEYLSPGVYYERVDASPPTISALRTDVAGFVGIAARGPLDTAVPVDSWRQFQGYFGGFIGAGYLAYAVRAFFENGGRRCWVVRVACKDPASGAAASAAAAELWAGGAPVWRIEASSPGAWGAGLTAQVIETRRAQAVAFPDGDPDSTRVESVAGFERGTFVRLRQGAIAALRVVAQVDALGRRLYWVDPRQERRLRYIFPPAALDSGQPARVESIEYTLLVFEGGRLVKTYEGLSLVPEHPRYGPVVLAPVRIARDPGQLARGSQPHEKRLFGAIPAGSLPPAPEPVTLRDLRDRDFTALQPLDLPAEPLALRGGRDGLSRLTPYDVVGEPMSAWDSDEMRALKQRGLQALAPVEEVAILAIPDIQIQPAPPPLRAVARCDPDPCLPGPEPSLVQPEELVDLPPIFTDEQVYQMQAAMIRQCEQLRDRVALIDPPFSVVRGAGIAPVQAWRARFDTNFAALYYPWLKVVDPLYPAGGRTRAIPPSGHVAGQFAASDFQVGIHKAPANELLAWAEDLTNVVSEASQGILNPLGINAIRAFPGRGLRIFGARTLSSDASWRYVNVRRLLLMIEKAIDLATQWSVFEPNDANTRAKLRLSLTNFLLELWRGGALMGETAAGAFFVRCDEVNNPPQERANGFLRAEVGVAPSYPFEFIVLRVGLTHNEFEITEV